MLNREETKRVYQHAYLPEYLIEYVESISDAKSHLHENYLSFFQKNTLYSSATHSEIHKKMFRKPIIGPVNISSLPPLPSLPLKSGFPITTSGSGQRTSIIGFNCLYCPSILQWIIWSDEPKES
tara:strand:- start:80 stop:451 length:372 start_codon:yes stop_codon:yes gene_type:complete